MTTEIESRCENKNDIEYREKVYWKKIDELNLRKSKEIFIKNYGREPKNNDDLDDVFKGLREIKSSYNQRSFPYHLSQGKNPPISESILPGGEKVRDFMKRMEQEK
ncbi:hypothetical protein LCGC14_1939070 [marine sediment metagenome]|uniref:Uncharacterized protein n=1 Tax=marine sediment metagenome TaxID=412755 RepID=A0A0F9HZA7_9ZZZZ